MKPDWSTETLPDAEPAAGLLGRWLNQILLKAREHAVIIPAAAQSPNK